MQYAEMRFTLVKLFTQIPLLAAMEARKSIYYIKCDNRIETIIVAGLDIPPSSIDL